MLIKLPVHYIIHFNSNPNPLLSSNNSLNSSRSSLSQSPQVRLSANNSYIHLKPSLKITMVHSMKNSKRDRIKYIQFNSKN